MNVVMNNNGGFIEVQGTAEGHPYSKDELNSMLELAEKGIKELITAQSAAIENP
jgi:ribonuclease PH